MRGRKSKYTPERVEMILDGVRDGLTHKHAALVAGIDEDTLINWRSRYSDFADRLAQAHADRARKWLDGIAAAAPNDWRAYESLIDRCAPDYRKAQRIEHSGPDGDPIRHEHTHRDLSAFTDDEIDALAAMAERRKTGELAS